MRQPWRWALLASLVVHAVLVLVVLRREPSRAPAASAARPTAFTVTRVALASGAHGGAASASQPNGTTEVPSLRASAGPAAPSAAAPPGVTPGPETTLAPSAAVPPGVAREPETPNAAVALRVAPAAETTPGAALAATPGVVAPGERDALFAEAQRAASPSTTPAPAGVGGAERAGAATTSGEVALAGAVPTSGVPVGAGGPGPSGRQEPGRGAGREGAPGGDLEGDVAGLVHARLAAAATRCYPPAAKRYGLAGTARVSFCTGGDGATRDASLSASSGASLLDDAATGCVIAAASPLPLAAASRCFTVPVRFLAR